jgi:cytochrome c oxidase accessory protein FixG
VSGQLAAPGKVLATLNEDGSRNWIRPRLAAGRFLNLRRGIGYGLIVLFVALPFVRIGGHPAIHLSIMERRFHLFGGSFLPTDSVLLMLLLLVIFLSIFWLTALVGRVWCGYGCPQTVYMELLFRPLERLFEGPAPAQRALDNQTGFKPRRVAKNVVFFVIAFGLANVFLAYFVSTNQLGVWITEPPWRHPVGFSVVAITTGLIFFDFAYFREQMCTVVCPYARLQSVLLDRNSLVVGYDPLRGETRKKLKSRKEADGSGDCIDCKACVNVCPTGIDIRDGLQLECISCAQCVDACDTIMTRVGRPKGLIRYASQEALTQIGGKTRLLRPRVVLYPMIIATLAVTLIVLLQRMQDFDVTVLRGLGGPFVALDAGQIQNHLRVKIQNRSTQEQRFAIRVAGVDPAQVVIPQNPLHVPADQSVTMPVFVTLPQGDFSDGRKTINLEVAPKGESDSDKTRALTYELLGPKAGSP